MRAVLADRTGPPDVLRVAELPDPMPEPGQVLAAVDVAAITFIETQLRSGRSPRPLEPDAFPLVLGNGSRARWSAPRRRGPGSSHPDGDLDRRTGRLRDARPGRGERRAPDSGRRRQPDRSRAARGRADALVLARAATIGTGETVAVTAAAGGPGNAL